MPYTDTDGRYPDLEYPVVIGYFAYGAALVTQALNGWPDLPSARALPDGEVFGAPGCRARSAQHFFLVTAVLLAPFALLAACFLAGAHRAGRGTRWRSPRRRPWSSPG